MSSGTKIEWSDATWNPVRGCSMAKGSEAGGCLNCYAARYALRGLQRDAAGEPFAVMRDSGPRWTGKVEIVESMFDRPLHWRKPRKIFVNSLSDLFHESLSFEDIARVFAKMVDAYWHTYQILTKRSSRLPEWDAFVRQNYIDKLGNVNFPGQRTGTISWPHPQIWMGVSIENQPTADARIRHLLQTSAAVRFVSYEPALGPVDFSSVEVDLGIRANVLIRWSDHPFGSMLTPSARIDQVIVGGESGTGARPFNIAWAESTVRQCKAAKIACFVKQLGAKPYLVREAAGAFIPDYEYNLVDRKGGDWDEFPSDLRVREFPDEVRA